MQIKSTIGYVIKAIFITFLFLILFHCQSIQAGNQGTDSINLNHVITDIRITGNSLTKPFIIKRELLFHLGDTLSHDQMNVLFERSEQNLLNTSLFNFVTITSSDKVDGSIVNISVIERWYIWPSPIFEITDRNINTWWASRDFTRINYGFRIKWSNFRGRMENLDAFIRFGKNHQYSILYDIPYIDKKKRFGAGIEIGYIRKREVGYETRNDKLDFIFNREFLLHQYYGAIRLSNRRNINTSHLVELKYQHDVFADSLLHYNPEYSYPQRLVLDFLSFYYKLKIDYRDAKYYPLSGWYLDVELFKAGVGFQFEGPVNTLWVKTTSRFFLPISARWYAGTSLVGKISSGSYQPYFLMQGLGYERDFVRGYEYYVVDGKHYVLNRNNLKFALLPERTANISFIPSEKFSRIHYASYLTMFADAGFVWGNKSQEGLLNSLPGSFLLGGGLGLDLVTYYDKVVRIEYSMNKLGESGIFIHLIAGI